MIDKIVELLEDKKIAILGFGREGKSTYQFIRKYLKDKEITIIDRDEKISDSNEISSDKNIHLILGNDYLQDLNEYDYIIKTPGISLNDMNIDNCVDKITSQLEIILELFRDNIIGITGTKGKSTTTSLIYNVLKDQNKDVFILGNIGIPIFDYIDEIKKDSILVIEMSAHQLQYVDFSPKYGIITNLFEEHLDYFGSKEKYYLSKLNMFKYQKKEDFAIYYKDNDELNNYVDDNYLAKKIKISLEDESDIYLKDGYVYSNLDNKKIYDTNEKRNLQGNHNLINIMFTLIISELFKLDHKKTIESINNFKNLDHRLELVGTFDGITYYDDCIATIPNATYNAILTLKDVDTLIFGGRDRGIDYSDFAKYLASGNISNLVCMKDSGYKIGNMIEKIGTNNKVIYVNSLEEAVEYAKKNTKKGKICLLSPAASSYNEFKNFEEKGKKYQELVIGG